MKMSSYICGTFCISIILGFIGVFYIDDVFHRKTNTIYTTSHMSEESSSISSEDVLPVDDALTALIYNPPPNLREWCWDDKLNGFFGLYSSNTPGKYLDGWYFLDRNKVTFIRASNNIWFYKEFDLGDHDKVNPNITGLPCKQVTELLQ